MKKPLSYAQRLALLIGKAAKSPLGDNGDSMGACFPYGMEAYVKCAASCKGKKINYDWR